jgi:pantothenate kinase
LNTLKKPYIEVIHKFAEDTQASFREKPISIPDYSHSVIDYLEGKSNTSPFTDAQEKDITELQP